MKQYLVFAHDRYYPSGGWNDFQKDFDSLDEATAYAKEVVDQKVWDRSHVVNTATQEVVKQYYS